MATENLTLLIFSETVHLHQWRGSHLVAEYAFDSVDQGRQQLATIIESTPMIPLSVVVDTANEELQTRLIPRVIGRSRGQLQQRTLQQTFPTMEYRTFVSQGTVTDQRRNEKLLVMAITQDEILNQWLTVLDELGVMVQQVTTASMVLAQIARRFRWSDQYELIVYRHFDGGLRQLFQNQGDAQLSRLSNRPADSSDLAQQFKEEATNTRQYLNNSKSIPRAANLTVRILHREQLGTQLSGELASLDQVQLELVDINSITKKLSLTITPEQTRADHLVSWFAASFPQKLPNFAPGKVGERFRQLIAGRWLTRAAVVATASMLVWSATELFSAWEIASRADDERALVSTWQQLELNALADAIPTDTAPLVMKQATELVQQINGQRRFPDQGLALVSAALTNDPNLQLRKVEWAAPGAELHYYKRPNDPSPGGVDQYGNYTDPESVQAEAAKETLFVELQIEPFNGDFQSALVKAESTARSIAGLTGVIDVEMVSSPLNVDSESAFSEEISTSSSDGDSPPEAIFQLVVTLESDGFARGPVL